MKKKHPVSKIFAQKIFQQLEFYFPKTEYSHLCRSYITNQFTRPTLKIFIRRKREARTEEKRRRIECEDTFDPSVPEILLKSEPILIILQRDIPPPGGLLMLKLSHYHLEKFAIEDNCTF